MHCYIMNVSIFTHTKTNRLTYKHCNKNTLLFPRHKLLSCGGMCVYVYVHISVTVASRTLHASQLSIKLVMYPSVCYLQTHIIMIVCCVSTFVSSLTPSPNTMRQCGMGVLLTNWQNADRKAHKGTFFF